jgi:ABC-type phosphate/phosphonate transport system substrate-binding protein
VADGGADVAALDCVSFAHLQRCDPQVTRRLRVLLRTASSPALPLITSRATDERTLLTLRAALRDVCADPTLAEIRARLFLDGVNTEPASGFVEVLDYERQAVQAGYPLLA